MLNVSKKFFWDLKGAYQSIKIPSFGLFNQFIMGIRVFFLISASTNVLQDAMADLIVLIFECLDIVTVSTRSGLKLVCFYLIFFIYLCEYKTTLFFMRVARVHADTKHAF